MMEKMWNQLETFKTSDKGTVISWKELYQINEQFKQVIWITIIGSRDKKDLHYYDDDVEMHETCDIVIEVIDGSYCEVFSHDHSFINRLAKYYKDVELLFPDSKKNSQ